jgi:uncharacterized low-complexity protein
MGQRGAAKATREKFKLEAFSHSTVSRSFRAFEEAQKMALESRFGEELKVSAIERAAPVGTAKRASAKRAEAAHPEGAFPSVMDTAARRKEMAGFFGEFFCAAKEGDVKAVEAAGRQFTKKWHEKTGRLLL